MSHFTHALGTSVLLTCAWWRISYDRRWLPPKLATEWRQTMALLYIPRLQHDQPAKPRRDVAEAWVVILLFLTAAVIGGVLDHAATIGP